MNNTLLYVSLMLITNNSLSMDIIEIERSLIKKEELDVLQSPQFKAVQNTLLASSKNRLDSLGKLIKLKRKSTLLEKMLPQNDNIMLQQTQQQIENKLTNAGSSNDRANAFLWQKNLDSAKKELGIAANDMSEAKKLLEKYEKEIADRTAMQAKL